MVDVRGVAHAFEGLLERRDVAAAHVDDGVGAAGHRPGVDDLGDRAEDALQKLTDDKVKELDAILKNKEAEILEV